MKALRIMTAILVVSVGAVLVWSGPAWSDKKGKNEKDEAKDAVEMSKTAKVTADQALKTATEKVEGKVIEVELERKHDRAVWEVEIVDPAGRVAEIHIDANTGAVIDIEVKGAEQKKGKKKD
jgi:uncharacterized membrane protein YkoI